MMVMTNLKCPLSTLSRHGSCVRVSTLTPHLATRHPIGQASRTDQQGTQLWASRTGNTHSSPAGGPASAPPPRGCSPTEGAKLSLLGRRKEPLDAVAAETGGTAIPCDLTDRTAMEAAFDAAHAANGPFDYVILNAGIGDSAPFLRTPRAMFDAIIATNLTAVFDGAQLAIARPARGRRAGQAPDRHRLGRRA